MEGPKDFEGVGSGEGRHSPSPVWGSGALPPPKKKLKFNSANLFILTRFQDRDKFIT